MSAKNPKAGRGTCPTCAAAVWFRKSPASGRLAFSCDSCDSTGYADPGGAAHAKWASSIATPIAAPADPTTPPAPPVKGKPAGFGLGLFGGAA